MNHSVDRRLTLLVAAACLAVLLTAPFACAADACAQMIDARCCGASVHDDGNDVMVKPLAAAPASVITAVAWHAEPATCAPLPRLDGAHLSAVRPLRI